MALCSVAVLFVLLFICLVLLCFGWCVVVMLVALVCCFDCVVCCGFFGCFVLGVELLFVFSLV